MHVTENSPWILVPSAVQPPKEKFEYTYARDVPLPLAVEIEVDGMLRYRCEYAGHGQNKIVYRIEGEDNNDRVLKLAKRWDSEPDVSAVLTQKCIALRPAIRICPEIYHVAVCRQIDRNGFEVADGEWFAWIAERVIPLDKYLRLPNVGFAACLKCTLRTQAVAAELGFLVSDNNVYNFGVSLGSQKMILIMDMGSREVLLYGLPKGFVNMKSIRKWWTKLLMEFRSPWQVDAIQECQEIWQNEVALHDVILKLSDAHLPASIRIPDITCEAQPGVAATQTPYFWQLFQKDTETVIWLEKTYMHGSIGSMKLLQTGEAVPIDEAEKQSTSSRVETLIKITEYLRGPYLNSPDDVLSEKVLCNILRKWKNDYTTWMESTSQQNLEAIIQGINNKTASYAQYKRFLRKRFRPMIFQMCGSYELVLFWIRVRACSRTLLVFKDIFETRRKIDQKCSCRRCPQAWIDRGWRCKQNPLIEDKQETLNRAVAVVETLSDSESDAGYDAVSDQMSSSWEWKHDSWRWQSWYD